MTQALHNAALSYAARGWSVLPIGREKRPALRSWKPYQTKRPTKTELAAWFSKPNVRGLAVVCGDVSGGLVVRDFDVVDGYEAWKAGHPELAATLPTARTGRGFHVYFTNGHRTIVKLEDGELRGGGYVVLPPSIHPSGSRYEWLVDLPAGELPEVDPAEAGLAHGHLTDEGGRHSSGSSALVCSRLARLSDGESGNLAEAIERAVALTIPAVEGVRNDCLFRFARVLKGIPDVAGLSFTELRPLVEIWHRRALPAISTKSFTATWADFTHGWERVKHPARANFMEQMMQEADRLPLPAAAAQYDETLTRRLVALCAVLQHEAGDRPFMLSCRSAAELLGTDRDTAWRRLGMLVSDCVLIVDEPGTKVRATRYRYVADKQKDKSDG